MPHGKEEVRRYVPQPSRCGVFVAQCDVSEIPLGRAPHRPVSFRTASAHLRFRYLLHRLQASFFSDNWTAKRLCTSALEEETPKILQNTGSVGKHVCIWIAKNGDDRTVRTKTYNKIVSNFEGGGSQTAHRRASCGPRGQPQAVLAPHLAASRRASPRMHAQRSFGYPRDELSSLKPTWSFRKSWPRFRRKGKSFSWSSRPAKQWKDLVSCLDLNLVLAERSQCQIYVTWYAHTETGREQNSGLSAATPRTPPRAQSWPPAKDRSSSTQTPQTFGLSPANKSKFPRFGEKRNEVAR